MTTTKPVLVGIRAVLARATIARGTEIRPKATEELFHKSVENLLDGLDLSSPPTQKRGGVVPFPARTSTTRMGFPMDKCAWVCYAVIPFEPGSDPEECAQVVGSAIRAEVEWFQSLSEEEQKRNRESDSPSLAAFRGLELSLFDKDAWMYEVGLTNEPPAGYVPHPDSPEARQRAQEGPSPQGGE